jgi:outer membrane usher protein
LACLAGLLCATPLQHAIAQDLPVPNPPTPALAVAPAETLLLETSINGNAVPDFVLAERRDDGRLIIPTSVLLGANLRATGTSETMADGQPGTALESLAGLHYEIDRARLTLAVSAPADAFLPNTRSLSESARSGQISPSPGAYLNYDLFASTERGRRDYGGLLELVAFNRWGSLVSGAAIRGNDQNRDVLRTETYFRKDLPGRMETVVVGDAIGSGGAWSRPVRFAGVRYARDFDLAPGYISYPLPSVAGAAALPSAIDILINNRHSGSTDVPTGPFDLTDIPIVSGAGEIQLVVRDLLGRQTVITQDYYATPALLRLGLSDFSYEAGKLRESFGTPDDHYGAAFAAGTFRRGLTASVTGEMRAEYQTDRRAAGLGVSVLVGQIGVIGAAAAYSETSVQRGGHYLASFQHASPRGGVSLSWSHFDEGFRQFGSVDTELRARDEFSVGAGLRLGSRVTLGSTFNRRTTWAGEQFSIAGINLGLELPGDAYLSLHGSRQLDTHHDWSVGFSLVVPLGRRRTLSFSSARDYNGQLVSRAQAEQSAPAGPGLGWRVAAERATSTRLQASAVLNSNYGQATADAEASDGRNSLRLGANGSLGWLGGLAFATRRIDHGAFAVVHVGDVPGVSVSLSNQVAAVTNRHGLALVPGLLPNQINTLTLDPDKLPIGVEIGGVREQRQPYARSGVLVEFPVRRSRDALLVLKQHDGQLLPIGAHVTMSPGDQDFVVARRGEVYLTGLPLVGRIDLRWQQGNCRISVALDTLVQAMTPAQAPPTLTCGEFR